MVAFAKNSDNIPEDIKERYQKLKANTEYLGLCRNATTDPKVVKRRMELAQNILFE